MQNKIIINFHILQSFIQFKSTFLQNENSIATLELSC